VSARVIALDLDGTIEDSRADMIGAVHRVRRALGGAARPDDAIEPHVSRGMAHLYRVCFDDLLAGAGPGEPAWEDVQRRYEDDYLEHIADTSRLYDDMPETLAALAAMTPLCCVTNKPERHARALLAALGVGHLFAEVVGGDTTAEIKPSPVLLVEAARRRGLALPAPAHALMIGDSAGDLKMAAAAGARSVFCAWGYHPARVGEAADFVAERPADLVRIARAAFGETA